MKLYEMIVARNTLAKIYKSNTSLPWGTLLKMKKFGKDTEAEAEFWNDSVNKILKEYTDAEGKIPTEKIILADNKIREEVGAIEKDDNKPFTTTEFKDLKITGTDFENLLCVCSDYTE